MDHVEINRAFWNDIAPDFVALGERLWALDQPEWGIWNTPNDRAPMLPPDMTGLEAVELGCGTGYISGWMAARGANVLGLDVSDQQLGTARRLAAQHGAQIDFRHLNAEATGLEDESFDFAISEYGAAIWCDPKLWLPEAWRILRPGGRLTFLGNHPLMHITTPLSGAKCDHALHRPYRTLGRLDWTRVQIDPGGVEFSLTFEAWLSLFREIGFDVTDYRELYAAEATTQDRFAVPADWAKSYPSEQIWWLTKPA